MIVSPTLKDKRTTQTDETSLGTCILDAILTSATAPAIDGRLYGNLLADMERRIRDARTDFCNCAAELMTHANWNRLAGYWMG